MKITFTLKKEGTGPRGQLGFAGAEIDIPAPYAKRAEEEP